MNAGHERLKFLEFRGSPMTMVMSEPEYEPETIIQKSIEEALEGSKQLPLTIKLHNGQIAISDIFPQVQSFKTQFDLLQATHNDWPSVRIDFFPAAPDLGVKFVPLDLRDGLADPLFSREPTFEEVARGTVQSGVATRAMHAGLSVTQVEPPEAKKNFITILSEFLGRRSAQPPIREDDEPPSDDFIVTTDEPMIEILFATGYFISTRQGFGISTPAIRRLKWGPYIFGMNISGHYKFSETLWVVPDVHEIHLRL